MRRITTLLALVAVCSLGVSAARACPKADCKNAATKAVKLVKGSGCSQQTCTTSDEFPTLVQMVGDKKVGCPMEAEKLAKANGGKIVYVVGSKQFECRQSAATAWAEAAEGYAKRFLTIACVVDGKVIYCDQPCSDAPDCCAAKAKLSKVDAKDCCKKGDAKVTKVASAEGSGCSKAAQAKLAGAEGSGCSKAAKAKLASAEGSSCSKASKAKLAGAEGSGCSKAAKAKLASAEGSGCSKAAKAKLASAEGKDCCKASKTQLAKSDDRQGYDAGYAAGYTEGMRDGMVKIHGQSWSRDGKTIKYRVAGRNFDAWDDAVKARDQAVAAAKTVSMKYIVDGKEVTCASQVCPEAKAAGKVVYVISGEKLECEYQARATLAKVQCEAAKKACTEHLAKL
jgi:hypothetical protein